MTFINRRWLKAAVATVGAGALTFGGSALAASATESDQFAPTETDKYAAAEALTGIPANELEAQEKSGTVEERVADAGFAYSVAHNGAVLAIDGAPDAHDLSTLPLPKANRAAQPIPGDPAAGSRPGAPVTIFLDWDGVTLKDTLWNYDLDSGEPRFAELVLDPAPAGATDAYKQRVWAAVAEDYAPFDVNVTTTDPGTAALVKDGPADEAYGSHVIITNSWTDKLPEMGTAGGVAFLGGTGSDALQGALVFVPALQGDGTFEASWKAVAEASSHEAGHNFGLEHAGIGDEEYYAPTEGLWGPIMGASYDTPVTQWTKAGAYQGITHTQDDLTVITDRAAAATILAMFKRADGTPYNLFAPYCSNAPAGEEPVPGNTFVESDGDACFEDRPLEPHWTYTDRASSAADTVGDGTADAATVDNAAGTFTAAEVITEADVDVYRLNTAGGPVTATVDVAAVSPNLNANLSLTDEAGNVLAEDTAQPTAVSAVEATGMGATIETDVPAGTYYLTVVGAGAGDPTTATSTNANGFIAYGSLGNYTLSGTAAPSEVVVVTPIAITAPANGTEVDGGSGVTVTGTATPGATITLTPGDVTTTADATGAWTAVVTANATGDTVIVASQTVDGTVQPQTASVTVTAKQGTVQLPAPVITSPKEGAVTDDTTPTVTGTGVAGATVNVTLAPKGAAPTAGTALAAKAAPAQASKAPAAITPIVGENGTWELTTAELAPGTYTVSANQSLNGLTSPESVAVNFTVTVEKTDDSGDGGDDLANTGAGFDFGTAALVGVGLLALGASTALLIRQRRNLTLGA